MKIVNAATFKELPQGTVFSVWENSQLSAPRVKQGWATPKIYRTTPLVDEFCLIDDRDQDELVQDVLKDGSSLYLDLEGTYHAAICKPTPMFVGSSTPVFAVWERQDFTQVIAKLKDLMGQLKDEGPEIDKPDTDREHCLLRFNTPTPQGNIYTRETVKVAFHQFGEKLASGKAILGEVVKGSLLRQERPLDIAPDNFVSVGIPTHQITSLILKDDGIFGMVTPFGLGEKHTRVLLENEQPQFAIRAFIKTNADGKVDLKEIVTFDIVSK